MRTFFLSLCVLTCVDLLAQNTIGLPTIVNYSKQTYNAGSQNWAIAQDKNGIMYFANGQGLLSFDGTAWRKYPLPNKTIVRSVLVDDDGRIYVGGQGEFGFFFPSTNGELSYTSLLPLLDDKAKDFADVWNICRFEKKIFFRSYRKIFAYDQKSIHVYDGLYWNFMGTSTSSLIASRQDEGLLYFKNGSWQKIAQNFTLPADINIRTSTVIGKDSSLLVSLNHGLYILHRDSLSQFSSDFIRSIASQNIYGASLIGDDRIALITNLSGCIVINKRGEFVQRLTKKEGIQNNNILSIFLDRDKNLWLGLDNGIDLALYNNAIKNIFPEPEDRNAGFSSIIYKDRLYLGLSSGAYSVPLNHNNDISYTRGEFQFLPGSKGQVWNLSEVYGKLLMGHNTGAYVVENDQAKMLDSKTGFWGFQSSADGRASMMVAGTYNGLNFYSFDNNRFINPQLHAQFESARFIVQHKNAIWIAHPYKGLYKVWIDDESGIPVVRFYEDKKKILSSNHNQLYSIGDKMVLTSDNGIFEFDDAQNDFVHSSQLENSLGYPVSYLKEDRYGNIWFSKNRKIGVWDKLSSKIVFIPELNNRIQADGFENINVIDSNNVLIAAEKGFFHLNFAEYKRKLSALSVMVRTVRTISGDSLAYGGYNLPKEISLPYGFNSLHFESASILYGQESTIEYSYFLEGFDKGWSSWSKKSEKDYTNIPPGHYVLKVRARNHLENESPVVSFSFTVLPPWYRTWWAYTLYSIAFVAALYWFFKRQQKKYRRQQQLKLQEQQHRHEEEQKRLQMQHQLQLSQNDKQIAQLKSEKLQAEVEHKNTELASSAMNLVHKAELLSKIKTDLIQFKEATHLDKGTKEFQKIIKLIDGELEHQQDWDQFAKHFDSVHSNYLKKLKEYCPELTSSELKLAAYLRLNLSTKEIAQLMNISIRGVETSRYRLRKKLGLTNEESNLHSFLAHITK